MVKVHKDFPLTVKLYHGYGHMQHLVIFGHVLEGKPIKPRKYTNNVLYNSIYLLRLFLEKPVAGVQLQLTWGEQVFTTVSEKDGFFLFEWQSSHEISAGWQDVEVCVLNTGKNAAANASGKIFIPHSVQYGFISDIDDTILVSYSANIRKRLHEIFTGQPHSRKTFEDIIHYFRLLSQAHTVTGIPNPFFYVSSSEWNLSDDLAEFFTYNTLPEGILLLNKRKRWFELLQTGNTKHLDKKSRIAAVLEMFPKQRFVLYGDNSQQDPELYASIANQFPEQIFAVYIRNVRKKNVSLAEEWLAAIQNSKIHVLVFNHTREALLHSIEVGLLEPATLPLIS